MDDQHTEQNVNSIEPAGEGREWVVLHVRPRCEKKAVNVCEQEDIAAYLPLRKKVHRYGRREHSFMSPLFPGYVFCIVDPDAKGFLRQNQYVANLLEVAEQQKLVRQLQQIERALAANDAVQVLPYLESGKLVRVTAGSLKGLEGIIQRVKGKTRVVISVDMIQQSVAIEVDAAMLTPA